MKRGFGSDNWSGVVPEIMEALHDANQGHQFAYGEGDEPYSKRAINQFRDLFGPSAQVFFVYNGTGANVLGTGHILKPWQGIIMAHSAHMNEDECGAPEKVMGNKLLTVHTDDGKLKPDDIKRFMGSIGFQHHVQPGMVSISQITELGTLYSPKEIKALADCCHRNNMLLHMDGARIANATVALGISPAATTVEAGVDILSFGGTKNGLMFGEAVVFFDPELAKGFEYTRKQGMQLHSKMRFIAAQFSRYLEGELWKKYAAHANMMARNLAGEIVTIPELSLSRKVEANAVFVHMPAEIIPLVQEAYFFHVWDESTHEVRLMCSWDTTEEDIRGLIKRIKEVL